MTQRLFVYAFPPRDPTIESIPVAVVAPVFAIFVVVFCRVPRRLQELGDAQSLLEGSSDEAGLGAAAAAPAYASLPLLLGYQILGIGRRGDDDAPAGVG